MVVGQTHGAVLTGLTDVTGGGTTVGQGQEVEVTIGGG